MGRPKSNNPISDILNKVPPQTVEMESALLGMLIDSPDIPEVNEVYRLLDEKYFYKPANQAAFKVISELKSKSDPVTIISVSDKARQMGLLEQLEGSAYIFELHSKAAQPSNGLYYFKIVYQKYLSREIIRISQEASKEAYEDVKDCFLQLEELEAKIKALNPSNTFKQHVSSISLADKMISEVDSIGSQSNIIFSYNIGDPRFDRTVSLSRDKILLISGPAGAGKSKFTGRLMFKLLERYPKDIAIYWVTLEDSAKEVMWGEISSKVFIKPKDLKYRRYNQKHIPAVRAEIEKIKKYDIVFLEQTAMCKNIVNNFVTFCEERKDKFCILVIDNILSLADRHLYPRDLNTMYDSIMSMLLECRQRTRALIIPIHHFKDAQQDKSQRPFGYRPTLVDLKGTEAFRRVPNQVLMVNTPKIYKDLIAEYDGVQKQILKRMFIVDTGKNREDASDDDVALIHYFCNLDHNYFKEIEMEDVIENKIGSDQIGQIVAI